jgi:hypothetical protein
MSVESTQRGELRRRIARHGLSKETLAQIAHALFPALAADAKLDDAQINEVNDAIDTLVLSGLSTGEAIGEAIRARLDSDPQDWRESFWRERLALAAVAWEAQGRPAQPPDRPSSLSTVPAIPPQPPNELGETEKRNDPLAA